MSGEAVRIRTAIELAWDGGPAAVEAAVLGLLGTAEAHDFITGSVREAEYQRTLWNDANKGPAEWFWTLGYLAAKVVHRDESPERQQHHITAAAGLLANWHAFVAANPDEDGHSRDSRAAAPPPRPCDVCGFVLADDDTLHRSPVAREYPCQECQFDSPPASPVSREGDGA